LRVATQKRIKKNRANIRRVKKLKPQWATRLCRKKEAKMDKIDLGKKDRGGGVNTISFSHKKRRGDERRTSGCGFHPIEQ